MKDSKTLLLALVSVALVITWVYHLYDKSRYSQQTSMLANQSASNPDRAQDSLRRELDSSLYSIDSNNVIADTVSQLQGELGERLTEIRRLKTEIGSILQKRKITISDLNEAKSLIRDLKKRIEEIQARNEQLSDEKDKLAGILTQITTEMNALQKTMEKLSIENREMARTLTDASTFIASELRLVAMQLRGDEKEIETNQAKKADKFVVSFIVKNYVSDHPGAELVVAITEPNGRIMTGEGWNTGHFETRTGNKLEYTRRVRFEYKKGEEKRLIFSIQTPDFQKGVYRMQVYHNGMVIGEASWMLG